MRPQITGMLDLVLQIGPCRFEPVTRKLFRVRGGADKPEIVAALSRADGMLDGTGQFWWVEARHLRTLEAELRRVADPLFQAELAFSRDDWPIAGSANIGRG